MVAKSNEYQNPSLRKRHASLARRVPTLLPLSLPPQHIPVSPIMVSNRANIFAQLIMRAGFKQGTRCERQPTRVHKQKTPPLETARLQRPPSRDGKGRTVSYSFVLTHVSPRGSAARQNCFACLDHPWFKNFSEEVNVIQLKTKVSK